MKYEELMRRKLYAFLHDPFHKPYVIATSLKLRNKDYCGEARAHEQEAAWVFKELFGDHKSFCKALKEISQYDKMASVLDRVLIPKGSKFARNNIEFVNPFNPKVRSPVSYPTSDLQKIKKFYDKLEEIMKSCGSDVKKCYHLLYALAEPLWYKFVENPPVADTRVPTHTVFDHNSATATMINIFNGKSFEGYLVEFDIPGIQAFISSGRGPGDLWARSWLISALAWYSIKELVEKLGPDILITPSARYNPFYLVTVYSMLNGSVRRKFEELLKDVKVNLMDVSQPVIPATIRLYLPKGTCSFLGLEAEDEVKCIEEHLMRRFEEGWEKVKEASLNALDKAELPKDLGIYLDEGVGTKLFVINEGRKEHNLKETNLDDLKRTLSEELKKVKPFRPSITIINLENAFNEFREKVWQGIEKEIKDLVNEKFEGIEFEYVEKDNLAEENLKYWFFLYWLFAVRFQREKEKKRRIRIGPKVLDGWTFETFKKAYNGTKPLALCNCGSPAIVRNSSDEPALYVRAKEALCPTCYVMRLMQYNAEEVAKELLGQTPRAVKAPRLSVATLAALPELAYIISKEVTMLNEDLSIAKYDFESLVEALKGALPSPKRSFEGKPTAPLELQRLLESLKNERDVIFTLKIDDKTVFLSKQDLSEIKNKLENLNKYIVMVKGDGDGMGDLASGKLGIESKDYFKEIYRYLDEESREKVAEGISSILKAVIRNILPQELGEKGPQQPKPPTTLPTPSYVAQLSYSLMISALLDARITEANFGVLVYAGGDDLVAIFPARAPTSKEVEKYVKKKLNLNWIRLLEPYLSPGLEAWWHTRLNYWGLFGGFHKDKGFFSPALVAYGRKYGVVIRHYRDPLSLVYREAGELEEEAKKVGRVFEGRFLEKDGTAVSYGRATGEAKGVVLPNTFFASDMKDMRCYKGICCNSLGTVLNWFISAVHERRLSKNFFYDLLRNYESLDNIFSGKGEAEIFANVLVSTATDNVQRGSKEKVERDFKCLANKLSKEVCNVYYNNKYVNPFSEFVKFSMEWYKATR